MSDLGEKVKTRAEWSSRQTEATAAMYVCLMHDAVDRIQRAGDRFIRDAVLRGASSASIWIRFSPGEVITVNYDVEFPTKLNEKEE